MTDTLLKTLWYTGGRNSEICYLQRKMVNFKERKMMFTGKGDIDRFVGIHPELFEALKLYAEKRPACSHRYFFTQENGDPLNPRLLQDRVKEAAKRIDIDLTPHGFNHLVASSSATLVQKIVGHTLLETTNLYDMATANVNGLADDVEDDF